MHEIVSLEGHRIGVRVTPPADTDLTFVYRQANSIRWNPDLGRLEDIYEGEQSHVASMQRVIEALQEEYGLRLTADPALRFEGIAASDRARIESMLGAR